MEAGIGLPVRRHSQKPDTVCAGVKQVSGRPAGSSGRFFQGEDPLAGTPNASRPIVRGNL
jgi:hypothetical protein